MRRVRGPVVQSLHTLVVQPGGVARFPGGVVCRLSRVGVARAYAEGFGIVVGGVLLSCGLHRALRRFVVGLHRSRAFRDALRRVVRSKGVGVRVVVFLLLALSGSVALPPEQAGKIDDLLQHEQIGVVLPRRLLVFQPRLGQLISPRRRVGLIRRQLLLVVGPKLCQSLAGGRHRIFGGGTRRAPPVKGVPQHGAVPAHGDVAVPESLVSSVERGILIVFGCIVKPRLLQLRRRSLPGVVVLQDLLVVGVARHQLFVVEAVKLLPELLGVLRAVVPAGSALGRLEDVGGRLLRRVTVDGQQLGALLLGRGLRLCALCFLMDSLRPRPRPRRVLLHGVDVAAVVGGDDFRSEGHCERLPGRPGARGLHLSLGLCLCVLCFVTGFLRPRLRPLRVLPQRVDASAVGAAAVGAAAVGGSGGLLLRGLYLDRLYLDRLGLGRAGLDRVGLVRGIDQLRHTSSPPCCFLEVVVDRALVHAVDLGESRELLR